MALDFGLLWTVQVINPVELLNGPLNQLGLDFGIVLLILFAAFLILSIIIRTFRKTFSPKKSTSRTVTKSTNIKQKNRTSIPIPPNTYRRSDDEILKTPIPQLSWQDFERLLALYFRDHGYDVEETGVGGKDGGVDLVLTDKSNGERWAVQAKHWADHRPVGPDIIRETHSARFNVKPTCHFAWVITSSDITPDARKEAQNRRMKYWHGGILAHEMSKWPKWQGATKTKRRRKTTAKPKNTIKPTQ